MANYHFHFKCSSFPFLVTELCFSNVQNYGQFEYLVLQEGDLISAYCSEKGYKDQYDFGHKVLFDELQTAEIFKRNSLLKESIVQFSNQELQNTYIDDAGWLNFYNGAREIISNFGRAYFIMEPMALSSLAECIERLSEREGLTQDQVLHDITLAKNFTDEEKRLVEVLNHLGHDKLEIHEKISPILLKIYDLYSYIAEKSGVNISLVEMMSDAEIINFLDSGTFDQNALEQKKQGAVFLAGEANGFQKVLTGAEYTGLKNILEPEFKGEIKGSVACRGKVTGRVTVHLSWLHTTQIPKGNILVAGMTNPQMMPLIKNAGAIVTDEGGLTCHAAIISREMKIPCVVGTKVATRVLKDGDLVEVDAEKGVVKIIERNK